VKEYRLYIFDMDGVLFCGDTPVPGAVQTLYELRRRGSVVRFLTNNSTKTREHNAQILRGMGFEAHAEEVFTSAIATARFLKGSRAWVLGEPGLFEELHAGGVEVVTDGDAGWVVVGLQRNLTYDQIDEAQWRIRSGARFLATNRDATYPVEKRVRPGAGMVVAAVAAAAEREPDVVIGKPEPTMVRMILDEAGADPSEALVIGDRLDTDIECARRAGCDSVLVLTGVTQEAPPEVVALPTVAHLLDETKA
jgi:4-nitrophenyl phosphatase